jgi:hypothetical protein
MPDLLLHVTEYEPFSKLILRKEILPVEGRDAHLNISMYNNGNDSPALLVNFLRSACDKPAPITSPGLRGFSFPDYGTCAQMTIPASWTEAWFTILHYQTVFTYLAITRVDPDIANAADIAKAMIADDCVEVWRVLSRQKNISVYKGLVPA